MSKSKAELPKPKCYDSDLEITEYEISYISYTTPTWENVLFFFNFHILG